MKTKLILLLGALFAGVAFAAEPVVSTTLQRIQTDPQGTAPTATAFFEQKTVIGDQTFVAPWQPVVWPLQSEKTVTLNGKTLTYTEVSAFVVAIAQQEYATKLAAEAAKAAEAPAK